MLFESTPNFIDFFMQNMCYVQSQRGFNGFKSDPPSKSFGSNTDKEEMVNAILLIRLKNVCPRSFSTGSFKIQRQPCVAFKLNICFSNLLSWAICETFSFISSNKGSGSRIPLFRAFLLNPRGEVVSGNPMNDDGTGGATERWRE